MFTYNANIYNVVDGDTIDAIVDLGFKLYIKMRLRLAGIDTPEKNTPLGKVVKQFVTDSLLDKNVVIQTTKPDKYGRTLATVILAGRVFNTVLLDKHYAQPYDGKKKLPWSDNV